MQVTNAIFTNASKLRMFQTGIYVQDGGGGNQNSLEMYTYTFKLKN